MDRYHIYLLVIGAGLAIRVVMHFVDKSRIKDEVESKGGRIISISWNPFGRGWFFEKNERHYSVTYTDRAGATVSTICKTSLFTGIYWADAPQSEEPRQKLFHAIVARSAVTPSAPNGALVRIAVNQSNSPEPRANAS